MTGRRQVRIASIIYRVLGHRADQIFCRHAADDRTILRAVERDGDTLGTAVRYRHREGFGRRNVTAEALNGDAVVVGRVGPATVSRDRQRAVSTGARVRRKRERQFRAAIGIFLSDFAGCDQFVEIRFIAVRVRVLGNHTARPLAGERRRGVGNYVGLVIDCWATPPTTGIAAALFFARAAAGRKVLNNRIARIRVVLPDHLDRRGWWRDILWRGLFRTRSCVKTSGDRRVLCRDIFFRRGFSRGLCRVGQGLLDRAGSGLEIGKGFCSFGGHFLARRAFGDLLTAFGRLPVLGQFLGHLAFGDRLAAFARHLFLDQRLGQSLFGRGFLGRGLLGLRLFLGLLLLLVFLFLLFLLALLLLLLSIVCVTAKFVGVVAARQALQCTTKSFQQLRPIDLEARGRRLVDRRNAGSLVGDIEDLDAALVGHHHFADETVALLHQDDVGLTTITDVNTDLGAANTDRRDRRIERHGIGVGLGDLAADEGKDTLHDRDRD